MSAITETRPQCDMREDCAETVTHIGENGYAYCAFHAPLRRGWERTRKMRPWELRWMREGRALPGYKAGPEPKPATTVYAAVIEWPEDLADRDPALILARSIDERAVGIAAEIQDTADAMTDPDWRDALVDLDGTEWANCADALENTVYGSPFITLYEKELTA